MTEMTQAELDEVVLVAADYCDGWVTRGLVGKLARAVLHLAEQVRRDTAIIIEEGERCAAKLAEAEATIHQLRTSLARFTPVMKGPVR